VYQTTDRGSTWRAINKGLANLDVRTLAIDPAEPSTLYVGTSGGIFKTSDSGGVWSEVNSGVRPVHSIAVDPSHPSIVYALGGDAAAGAQYPTAAAVYRSDNGGATWNAVNANLFYQDLFYRYQPNALLIDPLTPSTLYAVTDAEISKSTDSGASWTTIQGPLEQCGAHTLALDSEIPARLYAGGQRNGEGCLIKSSDGGQTWSNAENVVGLSVLALSSGPIDATTLYGAVQPGTDAFVSRLNADGLLDWSTYLGGGRADSANAIALDGSGKAWVAGATTSTDFPTLGLYNRSSAEPTTNTPVGMLLSSG
jgi:photosystem II stability/assembly factor-like uncharacterized protein